jgi:hypothetical protein
MSILKYSVDIDQYTFKNALLLGNAINHAKEGMKGTLGNRIVHWIIAVVEFLPIVGQIASLFEKFIVACVVKKIDCEGATYIGEVKNGKFHGKGVQSGDVDGVFCKYVGYFENDKSDGQGVYTWSDGDKYEGSYKNGEQHGQGVYTWSDGDKYEGSYENGNRHGEGVYTRLLDGVKFAQTWENGKMLKEEQIRN